MSDWFETLDGTLRHTWQQMARATKDAKSPLRTAVLATMSEAGPQQRILILRQASQSAATLTLFTDAATPKVAEMSSDPRVSIHLWDPRAQWQLRLSGTAALTPGPQETWDRMPEGAREVYGVTPTPGTPIPTPEDHDRTPDAAKFLQITIALHQIESTHLGAPLHRRARFRADEGWAGQWVAP